MEKAATKFWIAGAEGKLFVDRGGVGSLPMVMIHSLAGNTTQWQAQLEHLRKSRLWMNFWLR